MGHVTHSFVSLGNTQVPRDGPLSTEPCKISRQREYTDFPDDDLFRIVRSAKPKYVVGDAGTDCSPSSLSVSRSVFVIWLRVMG